MPKLIRQLSELRTNPIGFFQSLAREQGEIAMVELGPNRFYLINEPQVIREMLVNQSGKFEKFPRIARTKGLFGEGLLTSEGEFHMRQRRLAQPAFHRDRILSYGRVMVDSAVRFRERWKDGETADIAEDMGALALEIVQQTLFRTEATAPAEEISNDLATVLRGLNTLVLPLGSLLMALPTPEARRYRAALRHLDEVIYRVIEHHRASNRDHGDLLSMLLAAEDEQGTGRMDDRQLRDEVMTMFVAGHETVANALTWALYLLARHPEVQDRLAAEAGTEVPSPEQAESLAYTTRVFAEALRLYPPVWILGRRPLSAFECAGFSAPAKSILLVCMYVLHRQERFFPDPEVFDPDRWLEERRAERPKFSYLPFGTGNRVCIGERFAWMEGVLVLAALCQIWRFKTVEAQRIEPLGLMTLRPRFGLKLLVEKR